MTTWCVKVEKKKHGSDTPEQCLGYQNYLLKNINKKERETPKKRVEKRLLELDLENDSH